MNPYSRLKEHMEQSGAKHNPHEMTRARVINVSPLKIQIGETEIAAEFIYCSPVIKLGLNPGAISTETAGEKALKQCLKSFYEAFKINVDDWVLVQQSGNEIYVISKVVEA